MENTGKDMWQLLIVGPIEALGQQLGTFAPQLIGAMIIMGVGLILIAPLIERVLVQALKSLQIDKLSDKIQLAAALAKGGIRYKLSELIGKIVYWLIALTVVMAAFNVLEMDIAAQLIQYVINYIPKVIAALFILVIGIFAANFLGAMVRTVASNAGILQANLLAQLAQIVIVILASVAALQQLEVEFFGNVFLIILAGISLGCGLAFGLGCKDLAGKCANDIVDQISGRKR